MKSVPIRPVSHHVRCPLLCFEPNPGDGARSIPDARGTGSRSDFGSHHRRPHAVPVRLGRLSADPGDQHPGLWWVWLGRASTLFCSFTVKSSIGQPNRTSRTSQSRPIPHPNPPTVARFTLSHQIIVLLLVPLNQAKQKQKKLLFSP